MECGNFHVEASSKKHESVAGPICFCIPSPLFCQGLRPQAKTRFLREICKTPGPLLARAPIIWCCRFVAWLQGMATPWCQLFVKRCCVCTAVVQDTPATEFQFLQENIYLCHLSSSVLSDPGQPLTAAIFMATHATRVSLVPVKGLE